MAILATNNGGGNFQPIDAGNYVARCIQMIHIGTVEETIQNAIKHLNKVRLTWELPTEMKVWKDGEEEKSAVISKEFTLSLNEKATLRKYLASWRGKDFTEEQAKSFDITVLVSVPCLLNVIHKQSKDGTKTYAEIGSVSPLAKGMTCPPQVNKSVILSYDEFDYAIFEALPDFLKDKIKSSEEYKNMTNPGQSDVVSSFTEEVSDDLPLLENNDIMNKLMARKLEYLREFQLKYPLSHVGGSIGLMLHGIDLMRDLSKSDLDITNPGYIIDILSDHDDRSDPSDFDYSVSKSYPDGYYVKSDIRVSPEPSFEVISFNGNNYNVSLLRNILFWKQKYSKKGVLKHEHDLIVINGGERPPVPVYDPNDDDDLPF